MAPWKKFDFNDEVNAYFDVGAVVFLEEIQEN